MEPVIAAGSSVAVAIMAKVPVAGHVKTRLSPPLTPADAGELYRCFLHDKIEQVRSLRKVTPVVAYTPEDARGVFEALAPEFLLLPQHGADLGARLDGILARLLQAGHAAALAIDSDTPTLPLELLAQGVDLAADPEIDLVLGPTEDGGYYLIGVRAPHPELFSSMPWSTPAVLGETVRRARTGGLRVSQLSSWHDVDTPADLARLRAELARSATGDAPSTRRFLRAWRGWPASSAQ